MNVDKYMVLRELDDKENWKERVVVVTNDDHNAYVHMTREILDELICGLDLPGADDVGTDVMTEHLDVVSPSAGISEQSLGTDDGVYGTEDKENVRPKEKNSTAKCNKDKIVDNSPQNVLHGERKGPLTEIFDVLKHNQQTSVDVKLSQNELNKIADADVKIPLGTQDAEDDVSRDKAMQCPSKLTRKSPYEENNEAEINHNIGQMNEKVTFTDSTENAVFKGDHGIVPDGTHLTEGRDSVNGHSDMLLDKMVHNSPIKVIDDFKCNHQNVDPFKPRQQLLNSPVVPSETFLKHVETCENNYQDILAGEIASNKILNNLRVYQIDENIDEGMDDPFKPRQQLLNSPVIVCDISPDEVETSENKCPDIHSDKIESIKVIDNLKFKEVEKELDNPFESNQQLVNSPLIVNDNFLKEVGASENDCQNMMRNENASNKILDNLMDNQIYEELGDPFKPHQQLVNSPLIVNDNFLKEVGASENDCQHMMNGDIVSNKIVDNLKSNEIDEELEDPFKPHQQLVNSPLVIGETSLKEVEVSAINNQDLFPGEIHSNCVSDLMSHVISQGMSHVISEGMSQIISEGMSHVISEDTNLQLKPQLLNSPLILGGSSVSNRRYMLPDEKQSLSLSAVLDPSYNPNPVNSFIDSLKLYQFDVPAAAAVQEDAFSLRKHMSVGADFFNQQHTFDDSDFRPATEAADLFAATDFDFLESTTTSMRNESSLARCSLYVKFDPLVPNPLFHDLYDLPPEMLSHHVNKLPTPVLEPISEDSDMMQLEAPPLSHSTLNYSLMDVSPTGVDKLLAISPPSRQVKSDLRKEFADANAELNTIIEVLRYSENEWAECKRELQLRYESQLISKDQVIVASRKEFDEKMAAREKEHGATIKAYTEKLVDLTTSKSNMVGLVSEYEKTIVEVIQKMEHEKAEKEKALEELKKAQEENVSMEGILSTLNTKIQKCRSVFEAQATNEKRLKEKLELVCVELEKAKVNYEGLRTKAESKLKEANKHIHEQSEASTAQIASLTASNKMLQLQIDSLSADLKNKTAENASLMEICDELMAKLPSSSKS